MNAIRFRTGSIRRRLQFRTFPPMPWNAALDAAFQSRLKSSKMAQSARVFPAFRSTSNNLHFNLRGVQQRRWDRFEDGLGISNCRAGVGSKFLVSKVTRATLKE